MVPTVFSADDACAAVDAARFPPRGHRSVAFPIRPQLGRDVGEFLGAANDEVLVVLQVETAEALANLDGILAVEGVDAAFMGPFDLSFSLGIFERHGYPAGFDSPEFKAACERMAAACASAGVAAGNFATGVEPARAMLDAGFTLLAVGTDVGLLEGASRQHAAALQEMRATRARR